MTTSDTCPKCRHAEHDGYGCLNMASDNDCACDLRHASDPTSGGHDELLAEWSDRPAITRHSHGDQILGIENLVTALRAEQSARQAAEAKHREILESYEQAWNNTALWKEERDALQQRIDAALAVYRHDLGCAALRPIAPGFVAQACNCWRAALTTESKEPDPKLDQFTAAAAFPHQDGGLRP